MVFLSSLIASAYLYGTFHMYFEGCATCRGTPAKHPLSAATRPAGIAQEPGKLVHIPSGHHPV